MSQPPLFLPNLTTSPPGEWRYRVPETGQHFKGSNWPELEGQLRAHYAASGYPLPPDLFQRVESYICAAAPTYCVDERTGQPPVQYSSALALTFHTVLQGSKTLLAWLGTGRQLVSPEQASSRASTCSTCNFNQEPQGCTSCNLGTLKELIQRMIGKRSTPSDPSLKACAICYCDLKAKVHFPHSVLWNNMPPEQKERLPGYCWLLKEQL